MKKITTLLSTLFLCVTTLFATDYYLIGGFNDWTLKDSNYKFTESETTGVYTLNYNGTLTSGFKINDGTWDNADVNFGSNGEELVVGTSYAYGVGGGTADIAISGAVENPKLTLDINAKTLLVEGSAAEVEVSYAVHGSFSSDWVSTDLTEVSENVWEGDFSVTNESAEFGIKKLENGAQTEWWAASENVTVSEDVSLTLVNSDTKNINIAVGKYKFSFNADTKVLTITKTGSVAISSVAADALNVFAANGTIFANEAFEIYTLNGQNVTAQNGSLSGMYIVRMGSRAAKVTVK